MKWHAITISRMITSLSMQRRGNDVLRKVQSETKANIYLRGKTLHVHPQYAQIGEKVILRLRREHRSPTSSTGTPRSGSFWLSSREPMPKARRSVSNAVTTGGDKFTLKLPGVSDRKSLEQRADEELKVRAYTGYEGSFTGWLRTLCRADMAGRDPRHGVRIQERKLLRVGRRNDFCDKGASRVVTIGKRIEKQWITPSKIKQLLQQITGWNSPYSCFARWRSSPSRATPVGRGITNWRFRASVWQPSKAERTAACC